MASKINTREVSRLKRKKRIRKKLSGSPERPRLTVFRSDKHIYAQIIDDTAGTTLATASTLAPEYKQLGSLKGKVEAAKRVGDLIARKAKDKGINVTCEVTPHHLFLTDEMANTIGPGRSEVRPRLAKEADRAALRSHLETIDCFATDHAPHTSAEKDSSQPPPGFPGLETALPLYLELVREGVISIDELIDRVVNNPRKIFGLPDQPETWIEVDPDEEWLARGAEMFTRAKWTPFENWTLRGRVTRVVLRGTEVFRNGEVLAPPGFGRNVRG